MKDDSSPPFEPIARYLAGEGTSADHARVTAWLAADPDHQALLDRLGRAWSPPPSRAPLTDPAVMARRVSAAIQAPASAAGIASTPSGSDTTQEIRRQSPVRDGARAAHAGRPFMSNAIQVVAGAAVLGVIAVAVFIGRPFSSRTAPVARTYVTTAGHRATVTFADGSRATLAPSTTLRVTVGGPDAATAVTVTGEAMFTVAHHGSHPFTVRAGRVFTRVLGTSFLVRRYPDEVATRVVVADGRVAVHADHGSAPAAPLVLNANMMGVVGDSGDATVTPDIAVDDYTGLTSDRLVFRGTTVSDIITALNRAYDVDIRLSDTTLAAHKVTMTVPVPQRSIDDVLTLLSKTLNARYVRNGRVVTITPAGVTHRRLKPFTVETEHGR